MAPSISDEEATAGSNKQDALGDPISPDDPTRQHGSTFRLNPLEHARPNASYADYDVPDAYSNLDETIGLSLVQNPNGQPARPFRSPEQVRREGREHMRELPRPSPVYGLPEQEKPGEAKPGVFRLLTQLYTASYLIFFSILGTLTRLGLQALTTYPGTPIIFSSIWPNFAGSLIIGFLSEDTMLFRDHQNPRPRESRKRTDEENSGMPSANSDSAHPAPPPDPATKKTVPLYIGLATGFCGSLTSFSAFVRDMFLAASNDLPGNDAPPSRSGGYSVLAVLSVALTTVALSLAGLFLGGHLAATLRPFLPAVPARLTRSFLDRLAVPLGWGCWLAAVVMSVWPPDVRGGIVDAGGGSGSSGSGSTWRGAALFALAFAPAGCLLRFFASLRLNGRVAAFPLGTFVVNILGTAVLAAAWDLSHLSVGALEGGGGGAVVACQVLRGGIQDGFCGCLTTVSTWVAELAALRRRHAYVYGGASVMGGFVVVMAVMGGWRWSGGFESPVCA